jgi:hypothetical protein
VNSSTLETKRTLRISRSFIEIFFNVTLHDAWYDVYTGDYCLLVDSEEFTEYERPEGAFLKEARIIGEVKTVDGEKYERFTVETY